MRTILISAFATLLLAGAPALAATPAAVQAEQSPTMPGGSDMGRGGGKLASFLTPQQRAMFLMGARDQVKDMTPDQRKAWRQDQIQKVMAMSDGERARFKAYLQAKWDALPQDRKDRAQQRMARFGGQNPAQ